MQAAWTARAACAADRVSILLPFLRDWQWRDGLKRLWRLTLVGCAEI